MYMDDNNTTIVFDCAVSRVKTMADRSIRVELALPEGCIMQAAALMQCQQEEIYLQAVLSPKDGYSKTTE
jgi:hypothetical protein